MIDGSTTDENTRGVLDCRYLSYHTTRRKLHITVGAVPCFVVESSLSLLSSSTLFVLSPRRAKITRAFHES